MKEVLSFGAGVQSTTLLLMSCKGVLPKLDHVIFADTQWEPAAVYSHLEWCKEYAAKHGIEIVTRSAGNLREDLLEFWGQRKSADGKRHASIPAFIKNPDGSRGLVRRQCTGSYKIEVIERFIREEVLGLTRGRRWPSPERPLFRLFGHGERTSTRIPTEEGERKLREQYGLIGRDMAEVEIDGRMFSAQIIPGKPFSPMVRQWIGISTDEMRRMKRSMRPAYTIWHPLIEAEQLQRKIPGQFSWKTTGFDRADCLRWLESNGFPRAPRSACIGCPFRKNTEWARLTPAEFSDACEVDRLIRRNESLRLEAIGAGELRGQPYLHSSLVPLSEVDLGRDDHENEGMIEECTGGCGT